MTAPAGNSVRPPASTTGVATRAWNRSLTCAWPESSPVSISTISTVPSGMTDVPAARIGVPSRSRPEGGRPNRRCPKTCIVDDTATQKTITADIVDRAEPFNFVSRDLRSFFITLSCSWPLEQPLFSWDEGANLFQRPGYRELTKGDDEVSLCLLTGQ